MATGEGRSLLHTLMHNADGGVETRIRDTAGLDSRSVMLLSGLRTTTSPEGVPTIVRGSKSHDRWHDDAGRVKTQTLPGNRLISFGYDSNGNLTSLTPPGRAAHTMAHTPVDNLAGYTPPGTDGMLQYTYNRDRQLTSIIRSDGKTVTYTYHPTTARLESIGDGTTTFGLTYDEAGRVKTVSSPGASLEYWYDGSLLTGVVWSGPINAWIDFEYDNDLRLTRELVNDVPVAFGYDNDGVLTAAGALTITPDPANGRPTGTSVGNVSEAITYEQTGERKESIITVSGLERFRGATSTRDALGRAITETETLNGVTNTTTYGYDAAGRLETVHRNGTLVATYAYDTNGNRTSVSKNSQTTSPTYDGQDRLLTYGSTTYTYTANGELRTQTDGTGTTTYTYDSFGNLRSVALPDGRTIEYVIDGQNRRVGKKINGVFQQGWLYSDQLRIAAELDGTGQVVSRFIYGTRSNVPDLMIRSGITYRILSDQRGSPVLVVDTSSGETIQYRSYDEFGNITADTNPGLHPFGFAGGLYDRDTGLTRFGARDYDPHVGRWAAKDPIGFGGGDTNLYGYVMNDPVNLIDPSGLFPPLIMVPPQGVQDFATGAGSYVRGLYRFGRHLARRSGLMGSCEQDRVAVEDRLLQGAFNAFNTPAGRRQAFNEATSYIANNPERVAGRALTGIAVGTVAGAALGSKLGPGARVIGPALGGAAAYGDIRYAVEQGRAGLEDLIEAGVGGQAGSVGPSSCGCN